MQITESIKRKLGDCSHSTIDNDAERQKESQLTMRVPDGRALRVRVFGASSELQRLSVSEPSFSPAVP